MYRVNAGFIAGDHWLQDKAEGGRAIGEACHFVDFMQFIVGAPPVDVYAASVDAKSLGADDNFSATFRFADGSIGTIHYFASGDKSLMKEYVEIFGEGQVFRIEDFKNGYHHINGSVKTFGAKQDKGQDALIGAFADGVKSGESVIDIEEGYYTTLATFRLLESIVTGERKLI